MPKDITLSTIQIDEKPLIYSLERKDVNNINLHVQRNGSVYVSANMAVPAEKIDAFLQDMRELGFGPEQSFLLIKNSVEQKREEE